MGRLKVKKKTSEGVGGGSLRKRTRRVMWVTGSRRKEGDERMVEVQTWQQFFSTHLSRISFEGCAPPTHQQATHCLTDTHTDRTSSRKLFPSLYLYLKELEANVIGFWQSNYSPNCNRRKCSASIEKAIVQEHITFLPLKTVWNKTEQLVLLTSSSGVWEINKNMFNLYKSNESDTRQNTESSCRR